MISRVILLINFRKLEILCIKLCDFTNHSSVISNQNAKKNINLVMNEFTISDFTSDFNDFTNYFTNFGENMLLNITTKKLQNSIYNYNSNSDFIWFHEWFYQKFHEIWHSWFFEGFCVLKSCDFTNYSTWFQYKMLKKYQPSDFTNKFQWKNFSSWFQMNIDFEMCDFTKYVIHIWKISRILTFISDFKSDFKSDINDSKQWFQPKNTQPSLFS